MENPNTSGQPGYEEWLRIIGRHLDTNDLNSLTLFETREGFIVRASGENDREPEALEVPKANFAELYEDAISARGEGERRNKPSRFLPTGYEDFLRALGSRLDRRTAEAIVVCEFESSLAVSGLEPKVDEFRNTVFAPFEQYFLATDVQALLDDAFGKRDRRGILNRIKPNR